MKKNQLTLNQVKKFLLIKGLMITEKNKKNFTRNNLKSFYLTFLCSFGIILFFFILPIIFELKQNIIFASKEIQNNSKTNFKKVLNGERLEKLLKADDEVDLKNLFEDIDKLDELPNDIIRLSAPVIEQLFKDTNYNLENVLSLNSLLKKYLPSTLSSESEKNLKMKGLDGQLEMYFPPSITNVKSPQFCNKYLNGWTSNAVNIPGSESCVFDHTNTETEYNQPYMAPGQFFNRSSYPKQGY